MTSREVNESGDRLRPQTMNPAGTPRVTDMTEPRHAHTETRTVQAAHAAPPPPEAA